MDKQIEKDMIMLGDRTGPVVYVHGHLVHYDESNMKYHYADNHEPVSDVDLLGVNYRPCPRCGNKPTVEGHDACMGKLPGVEAACCGHGISDNHTHTYVKFTDGTVLREHEAEAYFKIMSLRQTSEKDIKNLEKEVRIKYELKQRASKAFKTINGLVLEFKDQKLTPTKMEEIKEVIDKEMVNRYNGLFDVKLKEGKEPGKLDILMSPTKKLVDEVMAQL